MTKYRLGIDAGGTFTDFVLANTDGTVRLFKTTSTPEDGTIAISDGLRQMAEAIDRPIGHILSNADLCVNGTTVALNARGQGQRRPERRGKDSPQDDFRQRRRHQGSRLTGLGR